MRCPISCSFFAVAVLMFSCSNKSKFDFRSFEKIANNKNSLLISCLRCGCVDEELEHIYKTNPELLNKYNIISDTTCLPQCTKSLPVTYLSKESQDSLSTDIYNLLIIDVKNKTVELVETEKMKNLPFLLK